MADAPGYPSLPKYLYTSFNKAVPDEWHVPSTFTADEMRAYVDADRALRATPSPPVAAPPATPVVWASPKQLAAMTDPDEAPHGRYLPVRKTRAGLFTEPLYAQPQPQPAQPLTGARSDEMRRQMIDECGDDYEKRGIFASGWLGAEQAHGITAPSTPTAGASHGQPT